MSATPLEQLLWDLEESLDAEGSLPLYTFAWWLRGQHRGLSEDEVEALSRQAYDVVVERHRLHLQWVTHASRTSGPAASDGTSLDFATHRTADAEVSEPFLALVPAGQ